jgi:hypothetical protein
MLSRIFFKQTLEISFIGSFVSKGVCLAAVTQKILISDKNRILVHSSQLITSLTELLMIILKVQPTIDRHVSLICIMKLGRLLISILEEDV